MKKGLLILILILGTTASILGQTPTETLRRRVLLLQVDNEIERSSKSAIDEGIVRQLENVIFPVRFPLFKFGSVTKRVPSADLNTILAEDYIRIGAGGEIITRQQEIANPQLSGYPGYVGASINDLSIRMYGETGIATSLLSIKEKRSGVEEIRKYRVTNVYVNRDNRWQLVSSQLTAYQG